MLFRVRHLLSRVGGQFRDFSGTITFDQAHPEASRVEFTIKTASIDTSVADRDTHLRSDDFFAVDTSPEITFVSDRVVPTGAGTFTVGGTLTIRRHWAAHRAARYLPRRGEGSVGQREDGVRGVDPDQP